MPNLMILALGLFTILDYTAARGAPCWRQAYGGVFLLVAIVAVVLAISSHTDPRRICFVLIGFFMINLFLLPVPFQPVVYIQYVLGDYATLAFIPVVLLLAGVRPLWFCSKRYQLQLAIFLFTGALIAPLVANAAWGGKYAWGGRYDPPHVFLIGYLCAVALKEKPAWQTISLTVLIVFVGVLAFWSGQRTNIILLMMSLCIIYWISFRFSARSMMRIITAVALVLLFTAGMTFLRPNASNSFRSLSLREKLTEHRFAKVAEGQDESLLGRVMEAYDVVEITKSENSIVHFLLGHGHGATFSPDHSFPEPNVTGKGVVHNIHIGPFMLFFRYGMVGLGVYIVLWLLVIWSLLTLRRCRKSGRRPVEHAVYAITLFLFLVNSTMRNVWIDPIFTFTLVGFFETRRLLSIDGPRHQGLAIT